MIHTQTISTPDPYDITIVRPVYETGPVTEWFEPKPDPSNPAPDHLPPGCVLWGPDEEGFYEYRDTAGTHYWAISKWVPLVVQTGTGTLDFIRSRPPTVPPPSPVAEASTFTWEDVKRTEGVFVPVGFEPHRLYSNGAGFVWWEYGANSAEAHDQAWIFGKFVLFPDPIPPHVAAKFPQPAPAVEQAGTVDAKYVAENAGEYESVNWTDNSKVRSDGSTVWYESGSRRGGADFARAHIISRFRPLPSPSANPPETPGSSGEPVNQYSTTYRNDLDRERAIGWSQAATAWREYHTAQLSALRAERDAALNTLAGLRVNLAALSLAAKSEKGGADGDEQPEPATPIGKCPKCGTPVYAIEGFCGVCEPLKL